MMKKLVVVCIVAALLGGCVTSGRPVATTGERRLADIVIPQLRLVDADIETVLQYLERCSGSEPQSNDSMERATINWKELERQRPTITVDIRNVSLLTVIKVVAASTGVDYQVTDAGVRFGKPIIGPAIHVNVVLSLSEQSGATENLSAEEH